MTPAIATIIGSVISAATAIVVCVITSKAQHTKFMAELDKQNALQEFRLKQLEEKVDKHNNFDRRLVALEEQVKTLFKNRD